MSRGQAAPDDFDAATRSAMPSSEVVSVRLLRHGEVEGFDRREVRGRIEVPLSPAGLRQHERLVEWMAAHEAPPDLLLSSDSGRCRELGERLARSTGVPLRAEACWREQDMGAWEGRTWAELTREEGAAVNAYWADYTGRAPPGGESFAEMSARVLAAFERQVLASGVRRAWIVTHAGVIRALLCRALGLPVTQALRFSPPVASVTSLLFAEAGAVVQGLGERPWLDAVPRVGASLGSRPRVALSGSAGTGKTTLGRALAAELGVPFLEEPMRTRVEGGLDPHALSHDRLRVLIEDLWREQVAAEDAALDGFVADRSSADYAAFWIHYGFHHDRAATEPRLAEWIARLARYDRVLLLPWGVLPLRADGVRSDNRWIQFMFQSLVEGLLARHAAPDQLLRLGPETDFAARCAWALAGLGRRGAASCA